METELKTNKHSPRNCGVDGTTELKGAYSVRETVLYGTLVLEEIIMVSDGPWQGVKENFVLTEDRKRLDVTITHHC